jgi:hypothetical protein
MKFKNSPVVCTSLVFVLALYVYLYSLRLYSNEFIKSVSLCCTSCCKCKCNCRCISSEYLVDVLVHTVDVPHRFGCTSMVYIAVSRKVAVDYLRVGAEVWMYLVRAAVPSRCTS